MISYGRLKKTAGNLAITLFTINRLGIWLAATFSILSEFFILYFTVNKVRYTEIDWSTYMQQVRHYMKGELNYTRIRGDTGPVV
jgi:alpha-1,3-mannosyltransferase